MGLKLKDAMKSHSRGGGIPIILPILFILSGSLLVVKLLEMHEIVYSVPFQMIEWNSAVGAILGGLYMIFKKFHHRKIII
ncbi:hypothetical protein GF327_01550 [Candidatus Woesearchaeota archaeon]|nr:hypothetical protein [Candidatus Woesearchaeota archaeon]